MFKKILAFIITFSILAFPTSMIMAREVKMSGLVPVCNTESLADGSFSDPCDFEVLMTMINYLIEWSLKYLATPVFALLFIYAGWLYLSDAANSGNKGKAKKIMKNALMGYLVILFAWLIVDTIMKALGFNQASFLTEYN